MKCFFPCGYAGREWFQSLKRIESDMHFNATNLRIRRVVPLCVVAALFLVVGCKDDQITDVTVSPGGRYIAYTTQAGALTLLDNSTSRSQTLEMRVSPHGGLAWSPQADQLVCVGNLDRAEDNDDLVLIDMKTGAMRTVAAHPARDFDPAFSAKGDSIYFASTRSGSADIYTALVRSDRVEPVIQGPYEQIRPRFSLDGRRLAYIGYERGEAEVFFTERLTSQGVRLKIDRQDDDGPIADIRWAEAEALDIYCRRPGRVTVYRYDFVNRLSKPLFTFNDPPADLTALEKVAIGSQNTILFIENGQLMRRGRLGIHTALTTDIPAPITQTAIDPISNTYVAVIGGRFPAGGHVDRPGVNLWIQDAALIEKYATYLTQRDRAQAIRLAGILARRAETPDEVNQARLLSGMLKWVDGQIADAGTEWMKVIEDKASYDTAREQKIRAARLLGELTLLGQNQPDVARGWFETAAQGANATSAPVCFAQSILTELPSASVGDYVAAVNAWRAEEYDQATPLFQELSGMASPALLSEMAGLVLGFEPQNLMTLSWMDQTAPTTRDSVWGDPADPRFRAAIALAGAYADADGPRSAEILLWLSMAEFVRNNPEAAREALRRAFGKQDAPEILEQIRLALYQHTLDNAHERYRWFRSGADRREQAMVDRYIREILLSSRVKTDIVLALSHEAAPWHLVPDFAEMREALQHGRSEQMGREQRFLQSQLVSVPPADRADVWRLLSAINAAMTSELYLARNNWPEARGLMERTLAFKPGLKDGPELEAFETYREWLGEQMALMDADRGSSVALRQILDVPGRMRLEESMDRQGGTPDMWRHAINEYKQMLRRSEYEELRPLIYYRMADAYMAAGYPPEQANTALAYAYANAPWPKLKRQILRRFARWHERQGDAYLQERVDHLLAAE